MNNISYLPPHGDYVAIAPDRSKGRVLSWYVTRRRAGALVLTADGTVTHARSGEWTFRRQTLADL